MMMEGNLSMDENKILTDSENLIVKICLDINLIEIFNKYFIETRYSNFCFISSINVVTKSINQCLDSFFYQIITQT